MLSSFVLLLVSSTFLVQNNYYATQTQRTGAQDNARVATELVGTEIRSAMKDPVLVAGARTFRFRSPIVLGVVCNRTGSGTADVHTEGGQAGLDVDEVAGVAALDPATGDWTYANTVWSSIDGGDALSATSCEANGADTTGASGEFHRLIGLDGLFATVPSEGSVVMLFRQSTFTIRPSVLDPGRLGLFRAVYGGSPVEFATGMDTTAQFQYRTGTGTYADTVTSADIGDVDAVRISAEARRPAQTGGRDDITFGWSVNVPLRNRE